MNEEDAKQMLDLSEDQLTVRLGALVSPHKHAKPLDDDEAKECADSWLKKNWNHATKLVCANEKIREILERKTVISDTGILIAVFSVLSAVFEPVIAALVSGLVVHRGLSSICGIA